VFLFKRVAVADSRHGDSMSGIQFPSITGYFGHYCQNRSQKLPRIITSEVWERIEPYLHTLYRPCIITQTKPVVLLCTQKVQSFKLAAWLRWSLQWAPRSLQTPVWHRKSGLRHLSTLLPNRQLLITLQFEAI